MKKTFLKKIISMAIAMATVSTILPLGVSAQASTTNNSANYTTTSTIQEDASRCISNSTSSIKRAGFVNINNTLYYYDKNGNLCTGWIKYNGRVYFADSTGAIQKGVIKIAGKVYYFNNQGIMLTGRVRINNVTYTFAKDGQAIGSKIPSYKKEFDVNGNLITGSDNSNNSGNSNNDNSNNNGNNNSGSNNGSNNNGNTNTGSSNNSNNNSSGSTGSSNTDGSSTVVAGLPTLPQTYSITTQSSAENKILELMNEKRREAGLQPLTMDNTLLDVARYKSNRMIQYNYFSHTNTDGTKWTNWLDTIGYKYNATAENIAYNTSDPVELFNQWWNSSGHRQNMMNPSYNKVGIGVIYGNNKYMGTQIFSN